MIESEIPYAREYHAECYEGHHTAYYSPRDNVVVMMKLVDGKCARDKGRAEERRKEQDHLPIRGRVGGHDFKLRIEVEEEVSKACPCGGGMSRGERFKGIVDLLLVACTDGAVVHDIGEACSCLGAAGGDVGFADCQEVRAEAPDEPFEEYLEDGGGDEGH